MTSIEEYYKKLKQEVDTRQQSLEDGGTKEKIFTQYALAQLSKDGPIGNVSVAYHAETNPKKKPHKINAFSIGEDYSTVDLYASIYKVGALITEITQDEVNEAFAKMKNFFDKASEKSFTQKISETDEIFDCACELSGDEELKEQLKTLNLTVLTNGTYGGDIPMPSVHNEITVRYLVVDLNALYKMSEDASSPVCVDFEKRGFKVPCISGADDNDTYQAYMAIVPGNLLADLYKEYGVRLMESNVRQFLQFTGKINKGIKETITNHPEMFLAYNNGIAATAEAITLDKTGRYIKDISNLQIVNGGQTTASLYHARNDDAKVTLDRIQVPVKFSIVKKQECFKDIVADISRCANTQNKVAEADFAANNSSLLQLEKMSKYCLTPTNNRRSIQTYWFFERAKGQYKNLRIKDGFNKDRERQFDLKYPKDQIFTKYELAKYINSYDLVTRTITNADGEEEIQTLVGPHSVCRGNERCFESYVRYNMPAAYNVDNIYFEDLIAKAILFREADRRYGTKNVDHIGDIKKTVVPYTIALLRKLTGNRIDLYKIWNRQRVSEELSEVLFRLMRQVDSFIITNSPDQRYEEWGKKEDCWKKMLEHQWQISLISIKDDLIDPNVPTKRTSTNLSDEEEANIAYGRDYLSNISQKIWKSISEWAKDGDFLTSMQLITCREIGRKVAYGQELTNSEVEKGMQIIDIVVHGAGGIDLLYAEYGKDDAVQLIPKPKAKTRPAFEELERMFTPDLLQRMYDFDKKAGVLKEYQYTQIYKTAHRVMIPTRNMIFGFWQSLENLKAHGFRP